MFSLENKRQNPGCEEFVEHISGATCGGLAGAHSATGFSSSVGRQASNLEQNRVALIHGMNLHLQVRGALEFAAVVVMSV